MNKQQKRDYAYMIMAQYERKGIILNLYEVMYNLDKYEGGI